ncbi:hypothetical protein TSAR_012739 [Trichomalopsis sarcophagae]|uniref:Uncharacterized protein n=1 Tax=Trichomalopsis sarcophagae TaxID=543379 RepID=A0A232FIK4_9HYME|nr:hypothetical protein TSAR_012739 [Trichomalopsis sarcophagae]
MCNCPEDKANPQKEPVTPKNDNELSPQGDSAEQQRESRQKKPCCKTKRVLTYEDETIIPGPCRDDNVIALPPPCPRRASPMRHCDLSGIAVVRRRIDSNKNRYDISSSTSPERKADTSKQGSSHVRSVTFKVPRTVEHTAAESPKSDADKHKEKDKDPEKAKDPEAAGEKGKESAEDKKDGEDKPKESESPPAPSGEPQPAAEASEQPKDKEAKDIVTSTPCPGKLNPNNECNCSPVPKIA